MKPKLIKKNIGKALKWISGILSVLLLSVLLALQLPYVQNRLFKKFLQQFNHTTSFSINHQHFQLRWLSIASITGLTVHDAQGNSLLTSEQVVLRINIWQQLKSILGSSTQEATNLQVQANNLTINAHHLTGKPIQQVLLIKALNSSLCLAPGRVVCQALRLETSQQSVLQGNCVVTYDASASLSDLYDKMQIQAQLNESIISSVDLGLFIPYFKLHKACYRFSGTIKGKLNDLHLNNFQFDLADSGNYLQGNLSLQGLPDMQKVVFNLELQHGCLQAQDLLPYLDSRHHHLLSKFVYVSPQGCIQGKYDDFTIKATLDTDLGKISTNIKFKVDPTTQLAAYKGALATNGFALGKLLNNQAVQQLIMRGHIDGRGLSWDTVHFRLAATIDKLDWNGYEYQNIDTQGIFTDTSFKGRFAVNDSHLQCQLNAAVELKKDRECLEIQGAVAHADLQALRLIGTPFTFHSELSIKMQGLSLDDGQVDVQLNGLCLGLADKQVELGELHFHTDQNDGKRSLLLDSSLVALQAEGDFAYTTLASDCKHLFQSFQHRLMSDVAAPPPKRSSPYTFAYQVHCKDVNPLLGIFKPAIYVSPGTRLEGSFVQDQSSTFSFKVTEGVQTLAFKQHIWKDAQLTLRASRTQEGVSAIVQLAAKQQQWNTFSTTEDLALNISWDQNHINFDTTMRQAGTPHQLCLQGHAVLTGTTVALTLDSQSIQVLGHKWYINPENSITLSRASTQFKNFDWISETQQVSLSGVLSTDPSQMLSLRIKNFALDNLNPLGIKSLGGTLNATAALRGKLGQVHIDSDIAIGRLVVDNYLLGDVQAKTNWKDTLQRLSLEGCLAYSAKQKIAIQGFYEPRKREKSLNFSVHLSEAPLANLEPLVSEVFSQLTGQLTGKLSISGSLANPRITGTASMKNAAVRINYLQALYQARGELTFVENCVKVDRLYLTDDQQGYSLLRGVISYKDLQDPYLDLRGEMTSFRLVDTNFRDNEHFYGTGILSGDIAINGPTSHLGISIKVKTNSGTHICIPVKESVNTIAHADFIHFVNSDEKEQVTQVQQMSLKGLKVNMLLDITPDAFAEIVLNENREDIIKGRGQGQLKVTVDTQGALSMAGGFEFLEGGYSFSLYRLVNKNFKILPQSKITWTDSPYEGLLDVKAAYEQRISLAPLLRARQEVTREKYPVQVVVHLQGILLSPEMDFQVKFLEAPSDVAVQTAISGFQKKAEDKLFLENQVMSLVVFKGFSKDYQIGTDSHAISRSLSELISSRLSSFASGLNDNLEIETDVDLEELRNKGIGGLRLKLSHSFLDGRLQISREGGLGLDEGLEVGSTRILGDWIVEYFLTRDGSVRTKFYSKHTASSAYINTNSSSFASGGVSVLYTLSFNRFSELNFKQWWNFLFRSRKQDPE